MCIDCIEFFPLIEAFLTLAYFVIATLYGSDLLVISYSIPGMKATALLAMKAMESITTNV